MPDVQELLRIAAIRRRRRGGWTPARLAPAFWGSADRVTVDGSNVLTAWPNMAGGSITGAAGTAAPTLVASGINGKPSLRFVAASSQYVTLDALAALLTGDDTPFTVAASVKPSQVAATATVFSAGSSSSATPFLAYDASTTPAWRASRHDDATGQAATRAGGTPATGVAQVVRYVFAGTTIDIVVNGVTVNSGAHDCGPLTLDRATVGAFRRTANSAFYSGDLRQIVIAPRAITPAEGALLDAYLAADAGVALP